MTFSRVIPLSGWITPTGLTWARDSRRLPSQVEESLPVPSPQSLVAFVTVLFVLLVATPLVLDVPYSVSAAIAFVLAFGLAVIVDRRIPADVDDSEDEITQESESNLPDLGRSDKDPAE